MAEYCYADRLQEIQKNNEIFVKMIEAEKRRLSVINQTVHAVDSKSLSKKKLDLKRHSVLPTFKSEKEISHLFLTNIANQPPKTGEVTENSRTSQSAANLNSDRDQEPPVTRRYFTEIFDSETEFADIFRLLEEDCLELIRQSDSVVDDYQALSNAENKNEQSFANDLKDVTNSLNELTAARDDLARQLEVKKAQLKASKSRKQAAPTELTESQKLEIYGKIFSIAVEIGIADKKDRKPSELTYGVAMDYLKELTFAAEKFIESQNTLRDMDKKMYERETREFQSEKRDRLRYEAEVYKEQQRVEDLRLKKEREERIEREKGGRRKDMIKYFIQEVDSGKHEKEKLEEEVAKDNLYFRED